MANVHITNAPQYRTTWFIALGVALVAASAALIWWMRGQADGRAERVVTPVVAAASALPIAVPTRAEVPAASVQTVQELQALQAHASREVAREPELKPIAGPITERPSFVSPLEWMMLKGVSAQHEAPEQELTRLVNSLRFNKLLELWQALPAEAQNRPQRQVYARSLLQELPQRVRHGDMALQEARSLQGQLLADAEPDEQVRAQRTRQEGQRLEQAAAERSARVAG